MERREGLILKVSRIGGFHFYVIVIRTGFSNTTNQVRSENCRGQKVGGVSLIGVLGDCYLNRDR